METILAFGMPGGWELMVIALLVIVFFGAKKIPEIARGMGSGIKEFKAAKKDIMEDPETKDPKKEPVKDSKLANN